MQDMRFASRNVDLLINAILHLMQFGSAICRLESSGGIVIINNNADRLFDHVVTIEIMR